MNACLILALGLLGQPEEASETPTEATPTEATQHVVLPPVESGESPGARSWVGKVQEVSGGPGGRSRAILLTQDGEQVSLHPLRPGDRRELVRLSGLRVRIRGAPGQSEWGPSNVRVADYEILDIGGGIKPRVGHIALLERDGGTRLLFVDGTGRADMLPASWTRKMRRHVGSKVWMAGPVKDGVFSPSRFAVLRPAKKKGKSQ